MQRPNARAIGHWLRSNVFDGWQVLGTVGLAIGAFGFALLLLKAGHALPSTGSTFQLLETLGSEVPMVHASATPVPIPSDTMTPSPTPRPSIPQPSVSPTPTPRPSIH